MEGEVIIQGFNIDHYSIVFASNHDYKSFYLQEMNIRKKLKYPPYYQICLIRMKGFNTNKILTEGNKIVSYLKENLKNELILGPSPNSMPKINNNYFFQIIIKYKNVSNIINELEFINNKYLINKDIQLEIDLNPSKI